MTDPIVKEVHASVPTLGVPVEILYAAESERDIEAAFKNLSQGSGAALLVTPNGFFLARRALIVTLARVTRYPPSIGRTSDNYHSRTAVRCLRGARLSLALV